MHYNHGIYGRKVYNAYNLYIFWCSLVCTHALLSNVYAYEPTLLD